MKLNVIIIDDEKPARSELRYLLEKNKDITILAECGNADEAIQAINDLKPQLIFLDINMPGKTGFELLEALEEPPHVIFVTAYDNHAIQAFEANAFDYLLKPVVPERLEKSLAELSKELEKENTLPRRQLQAHSKIFIKDGDRCHWITLGDIYLIESAGNYAKLMYGNKTVLTHRTLLVLEEMLPEELFFRVNRAQIVNIQFITAIDTYFKGGMLVELGSKAKVEMSQRQAVKFRERMGI